MLSLEGILFRLWRVWYWFWCWRSRWSTTRAALTETSPHAATSARPGIRDSDFEGTEEKDRLWMLIFRTERERAFASQAEARESYHRQYPEDRSKLSNWLASWSIKIFLIQKLSFFKIERIFFKWSASPQSTTTMTGTNTRATISTTPTGFLSELNSHFWYMYMCMYVFPV